MGKAMRRFEREVAREEKREREMRAAGKLPAIPPSDYKGSVAAWMIGLQERGLWDGQRPYFHGDVWITEAQYDELLTACEAE